MKPRRLFVTTALPYANGHFHIGHIMEYIQADIWVRMQRMSGHEVHFVCADDTHGAPIMIAAEKAGVTPQAFVADIAQNRRPYLEGFHIAFDHWHSTDSPENHRISQAIYCALRDQQLIEKRNIEQFFDPQKAMFLPDRFIKGQCPECGAKDQYGDSCEACGAVYSPTELLNPYSTLTGATPELRSSEHYFFKLSDPRCVDFLKQWAYQKGRLQSEVLNKIREWLEPEKEGGLSDWDISRDAPYFGIEIPDAPGKYFYVWLDAPIGYLASLEHWFALHQWDVEAFIQAPDVEQYHFIGKDITYFHTLFWPAILHFSGRKTPTGIFVHGFITVKGDKMSKSRGTGIDPLRYLSIGLDPEWLRYYIASKLNAHVEDIDFNPDDFVARINSDLIGKFVNIASRSMNFISKYFQGQLAPMDEQGQNLVHGLQKEVTEIHDLYQAREFAKAIRHIMSLADQVNAYIDAYKPWELAKNESAHPQLHQVCSTCVEAFRLLTLMLKPILPQLSERVEKMLHLAPLLFEHASLLMGSGHHISAYTHLMQRVDVQKLEALFESPENKG